MGRRVGWKEEMGGGEGEKMRVKPRMEGRQEGRRA